MDPVRWRRIEALFDQAIELPPAERAAVLRDCADDPDVQREVAAMLASDREARAALHGAVASAVQTLASQTIAARVGEHIGPFRLVGLLGEGGMGAVYLAERDDAQFAHRVAIKILPHAVGAPEAIARFRDERQILAALEHPNIVRLLDGGNTETGLPYLVMEHIEGATITRYADAHGLGVRARVGLMRQVCAALQYAHQNLVVHRDIKPGNILVGADGAPKILDFGIAKLLDDSTASRSSLGASFAREARTRTGFAMFTPEYASPEQARGDAISTATDVYSVGAVLYELVANAPAHRAAGSALEILRVICEVEPARPSAAGPRERRRELAGDLDNIILKALHKEPSRRYASMEQLANDLGRWLDGLPVEARTATLGYRAHKFVRRNKTAVAAAALVAASLVGATVVSLRQARRADEQAARAELEAAHAVEAAGRAQREADRARNAELRVQAQLDQIEAEQAARATAEAEARAKGSEAKLTREQLQVALAKTQQEKQVAEQQYAAARAAEARAAQQAAAAHEAESRAQQAARDEKATRQAAEALYARERDRVKQLEEAGKKITNQLR